MADAKKKPEVKATECPVSREEFRSKAPAMMEATVQGKPLSLERKEFGTGSLGFFHQAKMGIKIGDKDCVAQVQVTITLVGSKELAGKPEAVAK